jgi:magnesium chelatase family protein
MPALVGGGSIPKPGEISLAHHGILFLDELPEFGRHVLDSLREPLESKQIFISRANANFCFPANFQLIAAMNPSPSGSVSGQSSSMSKRVAKKYLQRLSGPLLDRFDLSIEVPKLPKGALSKQSDRLQRGDTTAIVKDRVRLARQLMYDRAGVINSHLTSKQLEKTCVLLPEDAFFLENAIEKLKLSVRAYHRMIKVARTIADLAQQPEIKKEHLMEALGYRAMDILLKQLDE